MKTRRKGALTAAGLLALLLAVGAVLAQGNFGQGQGQPGFGGPGFGGPGGPMGRPPMGAAVAATETAVYVVVGQQILLLDPDTLEVQVTKDLPMPQPPNMPGGGGQVLR